MLFVIVETDDSHTAPPECIVDLALRSHVDAFSRKITAETGSFDTLPKAVKPVLRNIMAAREVPFPPGRPSSL